MPERVSTTEFRGREHALLTSENHLITCYLNGSRTAHQIDHILVRSRRTPSVDDGRMFRGAVTGNTHSTNHALVRFRSKYRLSMRSRKLATSRLNVAALEMPEKRKTVDCDRNRIEHYHQYTEKRSLGGKSVQGAQDGNEGSELEGIRVDFKMIKRSDL